MHCIRSLLCTSINETPHERFFNFTRKSSFGLAMPTWLLSPGNVLLRKHVRASKYDPLVEEVELLETNPNYARVKFPNGNESNVNLRHLAPLPKDKHNGQNYPTTPGGQSSEPILPVQEFEEPSESPKTPLPVHEETPGEATQESPQREPTVRRSTRVSRPPDRLQYR